MSYDRVFKVPFQQLKLKGSMFHLSTEFLLYSDWSVSFSHARVTNVYVKQLDLSIKETNQ